MTKISVVIPVYNEAGNIGPLVERVRSVIGKDNELLVIDDCSTDNTFQEVNQDLAKVIRHDVNRGKGGAIRTGIANAVGEYIIFMDGDGQDDPEDLNLMIDVMEQGYDLVIGSRFVKVKEGAYAGVGRRFTSDALTPTNFVGNKGLTRIINTLFRTKITDSQAGYKCFRAEKLKSLPLESETFEIETEMLIRSARRNFRITETPVKRLERKMGNSKLFEVPFGRFKFGTRAMKTIIKGYFLWK